jgi:hypothetical protein
MGLNYGGKAAHSGVIATLTMPAALFLGGRSAPSTSPTIEGRNPWSQVLQLAEFNGSLYWRLSTTRQ